MNKMKKILLIGIFTFPTICVFGQEIKTLRRDKISIEYPSNWVVRDLDGYSMLVSEPEEKEWSVMTTFDIQIDANFKTVDAFCDNYKKKMTRNEIFKDFNIKSKKKISYKGNTAIEYNYSASVQDLPMEWKSIIFLRDNKIYKLTTTSLIGEFYLIKDKTDKIFDSFKIE
jgi:hypothetical protein